MADETLTLGTLFTGKMDATFMTVVRRLSTLTTQLNKALGGLSQAAGVSKSAMKGLGSEMSAYQVAAGKSLSRTKAYQQAFGKLGDTYGKSEAAMRKWLPMLNKADDAIGRQAMKFEQAGIGGQKYYNTASRLSVMQGKLAGNLKYTSEGISHVSKATTAAAASTTKATASTKKATEQFHGFTKQISKVHGGLNRVKAAFKVTASYGIAATAIYTVINAFKVGAQAIIDYDQALKNLQAITGATSAEVSAMGETIKDVARTTKFSTSEVAEGMVLLGQAGFDAGESMDAMQATANLATGTLSDMRLTTDLLTTTIRAFSLDTMEAGRVSDVMANAINKSKLTIDKLRISFNYIGATAAQAGVSLEETAATMMTLANNGLRASTIGTGMRQVLSRLIAPNSRLREAYEAQGVALDQVNPRTVGYQKVLQNLTAILYDSETNAVNMAKAFELFGLRGAQAAAILVKGYVGGEFQVALNNVFEVGTAAEMSGIQQEGLGVKFKNLADRAKLVAVALGVGGVGGALGIFTDMLAGITIVMEAFATSAIGGVIVKVTLLVAAFTALRMALSLLVSSFKGLLILKMITSNFALLTTGLGAATAGFTVMTGVLGKLRAAFTVLWALIAANPFVAIATAVTTLLVVLNDIAGSNKKLANELAVAAVEARRMAEGINLYSNSLEALDKDSREYQSVLERFQVTYPEVTREILKMVNAIDLADVATDDLTEAMNKVATREAWKSLDSATQSAEKYRKELERSKTSYFLWYIEFSELWPQFYHNLLGIGEAYDRNAKSVKALNEVQDAQVQALRTLVETGELTLEQAVERIQTMDREEDALEKLTAAFIAHFNRVGTAGNDAVVEVKRIFDELPLYFEQLYNQLDIKHQALFIKTLDQMQREVAAHRKRGKDMGVAEQELQDQIEAIRKMAFDKFVEGQNKEVEGKKKAEEKKLEEVQKAAEKELKIREKLLDQLKTLEERLQADLKMIRQEGYTDEEKYAEDLIVARQVLADAKKAAAEAETNDQIEEATKQLENAEKHYADLLTLANQASDDKVAKEKETTRAITDTRSREIEIVKDTDKKIVDSTRESQETITDIYGREWNFRQSRHKWASDIEQQQTADSIAYQERLRDEEMRNTINRVAKTYGEKSKRYQDWLEGYKRSMGQELVERVMNDMKMEESTKKAYNGMSTEAKKAFDEIKNENDKLKDKLKDPAKMETDIEDPKKDIKEIKDKDTELKEQVGEEKPINLVADDALAELDFLDTALGDIQTKAAIETLVNVVVETALEKMESLLGYLTLLVETKWTSTHTIVVKGLAALKSAIAYQKSVNGLNTRSTHTIVTKNVKEGEKETEPDYGPGGTYHSGGLVSGGQSLLERGEFVVRREAVSKYGAGFFDKLNSMMPTSMPTSGGGQIGAAGLRPIHLHINNTPHILYGDEQVVSGLVKSFRREGLVTA